MKNIKVMLFLSLLLGLVTASCSSEKAEVLLPDFGTINIGYLPILPSAPIFVAVEKGYFEELGLNVELHSFNSGQFMMPVLATGEIDFGAGQSGTEFFNAVNQGLNVKIVGGQTQERPGHGTAPVIVRKDLFDSGEITQPSDLKGKKIAINVERGLSEYLLAEVLSFGGLTLDDVEIVTMPFPDMNVALANQAIDAAHLPQPLSGQAIAEGVAVMLIDGDEIFENGQNGVLFFGKRLLEPENREIGVRFLMAWLKAVRDLSGEGWKDEELVAITSSYTKIPEPAIIHGVVMYFGPNGELNQEFVENIMMYFFEQGYTELTEPLPLSDIIDTSYMEEAVERMGRYEE